MNDRAGKLQKVPAGMSRDDILEAYAVTYAELIDCQHRLGEERLLVANLRRQLADVQTGGDRERTSR